VVHSNGDKVVARDGFVMEDSVFGGVVFAVASYHPFISAYNVRRNPMPTIAIPTLPHVRQNQLLYLSGHPKDTPSSEKHCEVLQLSMNTKIVPIRFKKMPIAVIFFANVRDHRCLPVARRLQQEGEQ
jgi:hypothetical protein